MTTRKLHGYKFQRVHGQQKITWSSGNKASTDALVKILDEVVGREKYSLERNDADHLVIQGQENLEIIARNGGEFSGSIQYENNRHLAALRPSL